MAGGGAEVQDMLSLLGLARTCQTICLRACVVSCSALLLTVGQALSAALPCRLSAPMASGQILAKLRKLYSKMNVEVENWKSCQVRSPPLRGRRLSWRSHSV